MLNALLTARDARRCQRSQFSPGAAPRPCRPCEQAASGGHGACWSMIGKVRIGDNRLGPFGQPLVRPGWSAPPFLLTAIPIEQADAWGAKPSALRRCRQAADAGGRCDTLGRAACVDSAHGRPAPLALPPPPHLDARRGAKADRILQGIEPIARPENGLGIDAVRCFIVSSFGRLHTAFLNVLQSGVYASSPIFHQPCDTTPSTAKYHAMSRSFAHERDFNCAFVRD